MAGAPSGQRTSKAVPLKTKPPGLSDREFEAELRLMSSLQYCHVLASRGGGLLGLIEGQLTQVANRKPIDLFRMGENHEYCAWQQHHRRVAGIQFQTQTSEVTLHEAVTLLSMHARCDKDAGVAWTFSSGRGWLVLQRTSNQTRLQSYLLICRNGEMESYRHSHSLRCPAHHRIQRPLQRVLQQAAELLHIPTLRYSCPTSANIRYKSVR